MGQAEIKDVLEKTKKWMLSREIAELAGLSLGSVQAGLSRMIKFGEVESRPARDVILDKTRLKSLCPAMAYKLREDYYEEEN
ncbi:hypothetical protein J4436_04015 [Candidatus Woesearchaeota archaeon]|nr:hypothetical protein [Candidatus Woesearchaeota archaeon]